VQDAVSTPYGRTWLVALIGALALFAFIEVVLDPAVRRLNTATTDAEFDARLGRVSALSVVELIGFLAIFTCMILMRFGL
jgi:hypothetical protein